MSLIPGIGGQNVGAGSAPSTYTEPTVDPIFTDPAEDPTKNEYYAQRMQTPPWVTAGFPDYASYAQNLREKEANARSLQEKQINASSGAQAAGVSASISTAGANQRAAVQAEIDKAKNAADAAHQAGLLALEQGKADEARKQFAISSQELQRYHSADIALRQQDQTLAGAKLGNDVYNKLADLASNPRNYMEQFFRMRGQEPPTGSGAYGNTSVTGPGLATFEQFLPKFLGGLGLGGGAQTQTSAPARTAAPAANQFGSTQNNPTNPYAGTNVNYGGSPTQADTAMINGVKTWAGGPYSGKPVDQSPANAGDLTPYLKNPNLAPPQMAQGGSVHMTAPHALVNLLSGKVAAIAGEAGPENAKFDGAVIKDPYGADTGIVPTVDPTVSPPPPAPTGGFSPTGTYTVGSTPPVFNGTSPLPGEPSSAALPIPGVVAPGTAPSAPSTATWSQADLQAMIAAANAANATRTAPTQTPAASTPTETVTTPSAGTGITTSPNVAPTITQVGGLPNIPGLLSDPIEGVPAGMGPPNFIAPPGGTVNSLGVVTPPPFELPTGVLPGPTTDTAPNPGPSPAPVVTPTNVPNPAPNFSVPSWLQNTPSGLGKNPTFLPEDAAANDPILAAMLKQGSFPPFLQRIFAQQKGLAGLGTNVPQPTELPAGVPLVSKLALGQMTPAERSAFESYLSSHGLDMDTYLSLVEAASPQGGASPSNSAIPSFLKQ